MNTFERKLKNLTKAQVEALLECFDFLANGYHETSFINLDDLWVVCLLNNRTKNVIRVFIHRDSYRIWSHGRTRKKLTFHDTRSLYDIMVNSDATLGVVRVSSRVSSKLVQGSLSGNMNGES